MDIPRRTANSCNATFHKRHLLPLLPPPSAVIKSSFASGYLLAPIFFTIGRWLAPRTAPYRDRCPHSPSPRSCSDRIPHRECVCTSDLILALPPHIPEAELQE